jgi:hypothetical protein
VIDVPDGVKDSRRAADDGPPPKRFRRCRAGLIGQPQFEVISSNASHRWVYCVARLYSPEHIGVAGSRQGVDSKQQGQSGVILAL